MTSTPELHTDAGEAFGLVRKGPPLPRVPAGIVPSADRGPVLDPMPDFLCMWGDTVLLGQIVPVLSCGEAEALAYLFAYADAHEEADEVRAIHLEHRKEPCWTDHNNGEPLN